MKHLMFTIAVVCATTAFAAPNVPRNHVPAKLDGVQTISPHAGSRNHVLVANVAGAIPAADWALCANYAASCLQINVFTNSVPAIPDRKVSGKAKIAVYVTDSADAEPVVAVPGKWSVVNVAWLRTDNPPVAVLRDRYAKLILKGIATACGSGATIEPLCSMFYGSRTLKGMDGTNITISPMAYFPMVETLRELGGAEAIARTFDED